MAEITSFPTTRKIAPGKTTPVPNELLDRVMPTLRDTELRVLLVVVRQTLGWQDGPNMSQRKGKDWLTQSQLMRRTGRASGAVARAIDALVQARLISVLDRFGAPLRTSAERRRHLGRLYYRLEPGGSTSDIRSKSEHAKAHTTKETERQKYRSHPKDVDNSVEKPFVIRAKGWERVTCAAGSSRSRNVEGTG